MKYKCSLNNNYEIIRLCDIEKFNQKISQFADKSWTQITISEKLNLPNNKPSIKNINKVYLDITITSTKIITTPSSNTPNLEGLNLTGKLLLVSGEICQRIVYISETIYDIVCSVKFNVKFSTYIVVDENTDLENDFFCIYPCVEDVSVRPLTERILTKSITLFLFAHKTTKTPLPPMMLENVFIFNSSDPDEQMASIEFDKSNRKLVVNSTGLSYNLPGLREAYKFELISADGINIKNSSSIGGNENADIFRDTLDNTNFEFGDLIKLTFSSNLRLWLTNYPNPNSKYYMISDNVQGFKITQNGITPYVLPNYIALDNSNSQRVLRIQFDIFSKSLLVVAISGNNTNPGTNNYFVVTLYEADGRTQKQIASVPGNSNARNFATNFNNTRFQFGDVLKISYEEANMVLITNFPTSATPIYRPTGKEKYFIITENGLVEFVRRIEKFPTNFVLKTSSNEEMAKIEFDKLNKELIVTSTGIPYSNQPNGNAFNFELIDSNGNPKISATIENNENADNFKDTLNSEIFEFGDTIALFYLDSSKISLNNYPDLNDTYNMIGNNRAEEFVITQDGITPILTPTKITINSKNNEEVLSIQFVRSRQIFIVSSKGVVPDPSSTDPYLRFRLKDDNGDDLVNANLNSNEDASSFKFQVNRRPFQYGQDSLTLIYKDKSKIKISNYPNDGDTYTPPDDFNIFLIDPNGLTNIAFNSKIKILNDNDEEMSTLYFIQPFARPIITITTTSTSSISTNSGQPNEQYVQFLNYSERRPEFSSEILKRADASNFARALNNRPIEINEPQFLRLSNRLNERVIITNYKGENEYKVEEEPEFLEVTHNSFNPHDLNYNKIRFKNSDNSTILHIYFDKVSSRSIYIESYSTGVINNDTISFTFKILTPDGIDTVLDKTIDRGETGDVVQIDPPYNIFNQFNFGFLFTLEYSDPNLVEIFDFPFTDPPRNPTGISQIFQIAQNGLVPISRLSINQIIFRGFNGAKIAEVRFNTANNTLIVTSTGAIANNRFANQEYFALQLKVFDGTLRAESTVKGNENANIFKDELNGEDFEYGDIITLRFKEASRVELFNFPNISEIFRPQTSTTTYSVKITENSLEPIPTPPVVGRLPNSFILKTFDTDEEMAKVEFNTQNLTLIVTSTGKVYNNGTGTVFEFEILNLNGDVQVFDSITGDDNANSFTILNDSDFSYNEIVNLTFEDASKAILTNYPNQNDNYKMLTRNKQSFVITQNGIVPNILQNTITLNNQNSLPIVTIEFDKLNRQFVINSTGRITKSTGGINYFRITLYQADGITAKQQQSIGGNNPGTFLKIAFNNIDFNFSDVLKLEYEENNKVLISNYPNKGGQPYNPKGTEEYFKITQNALEPFTPPPTIVKLPNAFIFKNFENEEMARLEFDVTNMNLIVTTTGATLPFGQSQIPTDVTLLASDGTSKAEGYIATNSSNLNNFKNPLNSQIFGFNDSIKLVYSYEELIVLSNYPMPGEDYPMPKALRFKEVKNFSITQTGIIPQ